MKVFSALFGMLARCRIAAAALLGLGALALFWNGLGVSDLLPAPGVAVAESSSASYREAPLSVLPKERAALLQSTVDSVALSLGSVLVAPPSAPGDAAGREAARQASLSGVLSELTFSLGGEVYFTAWEGTRMVHSPLVPDVVDMDFADALDGRGSAFVQRMEALAEDGGGFLQVTLPRQMPDKMTGTGRAVHGATPHGAPGDADETVPEAAKAGMDDARGDGAKAVSAGAPASFVVRGLVDRSLRQPDDSAEGLFPASEFCPVDAGRPCAGGHALPSPRIDFTPVEQVVYVRGIPNSGWHIAAFMPLEPRNAPGEGFSSVWLADAGKADGERRGLLRKGLCLSGFSLAGLAGLMLVPGAGRGRRDKAAREAGA